jgi:hypothetical protein
MIGFIYIWGVSKYLKQIVKMAFYPEKKEIAEMIMAGVRDFYDGRFGAFKSTPIVKE